MSETKKTAAAESINSVVDAATGEFKRPAAQFRNHISSKPGSPFPPESGRYHLYVSYACPWAHRTLIMRNLKGLQSIIDFTSVHWYMDLGGIGWRFAKADEKLSGENVTPDPVNGVETIRDLYLLAEPNYTGRFSVPVLWDKKTKTIVSNESSEIIRMFATEFNDLLDEDHRSINIIPNSLIASIDKMNQWIYDDINNGVYKCGIAKSQAAYEKNVTQLFDSLDRVESLLANSTGPYILGNELTEVDLRLYPTIVRFDVVYVTLFKTNLDTIRSGFPAIHKWLRHLYWDLPAFGQTTNFEHIKRHYFSSITTLNPEGIVPLGPRPEILGKQIEAVK
ncbi:hypothetical protein OIDMADRAFT_165197 [Oidiodendron maius Zn]|uniref:GST C-terminal domain-containing protein n=1 Tax=Oidiodendron maius (strain Zn) TaxID=913774 RepID=A0A0C3DF32_OIDMZ|nr:hypothetical protein OIDMADRAFT_165197 [Oidiodendron maius Zn]